MPERLLLVAGEVRLHELGPQPRLDERVPRSVLHRAAGQREERRRAGVTWDRIASVKSSMSAPAIDSPKASKAAPIAAPSSGTKKIRPNRRSQNAPPMGRSRRGCSPQRVFGFLVPAYQDIVHRAPGSTSAGRALQAGR